MSSPENNLELRPLALEHAEDLFAAVDQNREYLAEWLPWVDETVDVEDSRSYIRTCLRQHERGNGVHFGIFVPRSLSGVISLQNIQTERSDAEVGYWISQSVSGRGYMTEAVNRVAQFALANLGLSSLILRADTENIGSNKVAEKNGFILEGTENGSGYSTYNVWRRQLTEIE